MDSDQLEIGVVGAGSWGTALANLLAMQGFTIDLWVYEQDIKEQIEIHRENAVFLSGITLSPNLRPSNDLSEVIADKDVLLIVVPSHVMRSICQKMAAELSPKTIVISASKGIENHTYLTMTGVIKDTIPAVTDDRLAVLSGPSFAREVAQNVPTAVTMASKSLEVAQLLQQVFASRFFRVYSHEDVLGVELGGAVKNVIAIATGMIDGLKLGLNSRAALITRGQTEIRRLGVALGANPRTFTGLAGIGDLILTCTGSLSRNYTVGVKLGQGMTLKEILAEMQMVAEGVNTAKSVFNLSRKVEVEMPIAREVYHILFEDRSPKEALYRLMTRDLKQELDNI